MNVLGPFMICVIAEDKEPMQLDCASCDARFDNAWALCQHCHDEHNLSIFRTKVMNAVSPDG